MKKVICLLLAAVMVLSLAGCGDASSTQTAAAELTAQGGENSSDSARNSGAAAARSDQTTDAASFDASDIDVDLTKLSSTMVYSEVYNMMCDPSSYVGKTVKMTGRFTLYQATDGDGQPVPDQLYYACVIADATACCQQGLEFILAGNKQYPEDYPELSKEITVVGEFQTYMEGTRMYCHLVNAQLVG